MRTLYVLAVICVVGTCAKPANEEKDPKAVACAKKFNVDIEVMNKLDTDKSFKPPEDVYCVINCMMATQMKGLNKTMYEFLIWAVKEADERVGIKNRSYTRKDLEDILNGCKSKESNECEFTKCIKVMDPPISDFYLHYI